MFSNKGKDRSALTKLFLSPLNVLGLTSDPWFCSCHAPGFCFCELAAVRREVAQ
jgi:hypothetical protein